MQKYMVRFKKVKLAFKSLPLLDLQKSHLRYIMFPLSQTTFVKTFFIALMPRQ